MEECKCSEVEQAGSVVHGTKLHETLFVIGRGSSFLSNEVINMQHDPKPCGLEGQHNGPICSMSVYFK